MSGRWEWGWRWQSDSVIEARRRRVRTLRLFWIFTWSFACGLGFSGVLDAESLSSTQTSFGLAGMLVLWSLGMLAGLMTGSDR